MALEAEITCPHCRKPVTVRIKDRQPPPDDFHEYGLAESMDQIFDRVDRMFVRLFRRG